jgi:hypothetical protein
MAGRLTGSLDGRPVVIDADASGIVLSLASFRALWGMRRIAGPLMPVLGVLKRHGTHVRLRIAGLVSLDVLPRPSPLVRIFAPGLLHVA